MVMLALTPLNDNEREIIRAIAMDSAPIVTKQTRYLALDVENRGPSSRGETVGTVRSEARSVLRSVCPMIDGITPESGGGL